MSDTNTNTTSTPKAAKEQTPEQKAAKLRAQAKALRAAAEGMDAKGSKPLVKRAEALDEEAQAISPAKVRETKTKTPKEPRPPCPATKKDGTACTARCAEGKDTCVDHQPAWDRLSADEQAYWTGLVEGPSDRLLDLIVTEIGWHRAKAIANGKA